MAADTDTLIRTRYARDLMKSVVRNNLHSVLTVKAADGTSPIVVALGHEKVDVVFARVQSAGGSANLFVVDSDEKLHIIEMVAKHQAPAESDIELEKSTDVSDVHNNITMDYLVMFMRQQSAKTGILRVRFSGVDLEATAGAELDLAAA
ncbi:hypothetical protein [Microbacterium sp. A93]|uniref:hypothetical protein n=1 Tax=Microbacterium sp. A93 TaxID=3450716 RepID=UPI003F42C0F3